MTVNSFIKINDMFILLRKITYNEDKTVENLLQSTVLDLQGDGSTDNLKALYYFISFRINCRDNLVLSNSYENVIHKCLALLHSVAAKDATINAMLGSIIENCLYLIEEDNLSNIFLQLVNFIEKNMFPNNEITLEQVDNYTNLTLSLHVLDKVCSFISHQSANNLKFPVTLSGALVNLIPKLTTEVSRKLFVSVLPNFIFSQDSNVILEKIWQELVRLDSYENYIGKQLFYLCLLSDYFISVTSSKCSLPLHGKPEFWGIVQKGLCSEDSLNRKQSLYLLKKYIEVLENCDQNIKLDCFYWDVDNKDKLMEFWIKILILLEVIEEKQTHLITPALKGFNELLLLCSLDEKACYSWVYCLFVRLLNHSSHIIVKWSLKEFCKIDVSLLFHESKLKKLLSSFFNSLNNMFLFKIDNGSGPNFNLEDLLEQWFTEIIVKDSSGKVFECVLEHLANIAWSPIPLFYVTNAISKVPPKPLLNVNCLNHLSKILIVTLKNQCVLIRSAIQCRLLKSICQLYRNDMDIISITIFLCRFNNKESLKRGTGIWKTCVDWIENVPSNEVAKFFEFCHDRIFNKKNILDPKISITIQSLSRMFILLTDSNKFSTKDDAKTILNSLFEQFYECEKRVYSCSKTQDNCLEFLKCLMDECHTCSNSNMKEHKLLKLIEEQIPHLLCYIEVQLLKGPIESMETVLLYEKTFNEIVNNNFLVRCTSVEMLKLFNTALHVLSKNVSPFHEYLTVTIVYQYYQVSLQKTKSLENTSIDKKIVDNIFIRRLFSKDLTNILLSVDPLFSLRGKLISGIMHTLWCTFTLYLEHKKDINTIIEVFPISMLIDFALDGINEDGKQSLVPILKSFVHLLPSYKNFEKIKKFISISWNACFELRKSELFWFAIKEWIKMVYQDGIAGNIECYNLIINYGKKIMEFGEELSGLVDFFVDQCRNLSFIPEFYQILSSGLVFGTILKKDKRMEMEVCCFITKSMESGSLESFGSGIMLRTDREVRLKTLNLLLTVNNLESRNVIIVCVVNELLMYDSELTKNNKRYFNDSLIHRKKNKLLQALLIIENYIYLNPSDQLQQLPEIIYNWIIQSLVTNSQQPSIRYQLEWLFVRLSLHYPLFLNSFWDHFSKAGNERLGSMCSLISIAYHLAVVRNDNHFLEQCVDNILPWCMSQNFNIRLYAQVLLSKLWNSYPELSKKYNCISKNQWKIYEQEGNNMLINAKKIENDFYFSAFHPFYHFNLQTIYWDLPRLSNISVEEWIHLDVLKKYTHLCLPNNPVDVGKSLESCLSPMWVIKSTGVTENHFDGSNIQKKFIPWKAMFPEHGEKANYEKDGLILVASLIEKAANLGGLARTCEVFSAKELVISNLEVVKEKEFISLSMTAEKHINITEVKAHNLSDYLKVMKSKGYLLIGAEQTTGSVSLSSYQFPDQCILLLGSEKEGIPPNLLPLLEAYIEIPQLGLVRSLNVHVTGAIFLWEYSKQHLFSKR